MDLRKLDALIGEHIFGFKIIDYKAVGRIDKHIETKEGGVIVLPQYSSHIASAWAVVEKLDLFSSYHLERGTPLFTNRYGDFEDKWQVMEYFNNDEWAPVGMADTAPQAICLAALKTKGIDISEWENK